MPPTHGPGVISRQAVPLRAHCKAAPIAPVPPPSTSTGIERISILIGRLGKIAAMTTTLTTPLYYVNDRPHIGSVYTTLAVDALARYRRLRGDQVIFITGCDEHGQKILRTAEQAGIDSQSYCDKISAEFAKNWQEWGISNDRFIRTTDPRHKIIVNQFFERVLANGDIVEGRQQGWYCVACEEYKEVAAGAVAPQCLIHQKDLEWRDECNLFFRLSRYQEQIQSLISKDSFIRPSSRRREVENFAAAGLRDFSISRLDLPWGIQVPGYANHTFYVWFDALLGYITALLEPDDPADLDLAIARGWPAKLHVIGKDILRFHAIYWPAMCISAGIDPPLGVFGHGFLTREGLKMGKSMGNSIEPRKLLDCYGVDAVRWYLLRDIQLGDDGDIQQQRMVELVNNDLANTIGNLVNRSIAMARKWFDGVPSLGNPPASDHSLAKVCEEIMERLDLKYTELDFRSAAEDIILLATSANGYLSETAPWKAFKNPANHQKVASDIYVILEVCRWIGVLLYPILPSLSIRLLSQLGVSDFDWNSQLNWGLLISGSELPEPSPLLQRLELEDEM
jgi:methionyl-tRNA synthetase